ncbi:hypothetical protein [Streptomyces flavofungini]|uniref:hypothetical protein n=1 Tax=Streptomyces flavofungini TaxID=68200 RepID=UPI0025AF2A31|nr:hypothetical protein [Streptomyces flavofungini]WJV45871.1 hypothetical protein QUY26_10190 [Streptomyces flavofungini]
MHNRLPLLAVCLTLAAFGASACDSSGDRGSSASATPPATSTSSAPSAPSGSPSASPDGARGLTEVSAAFYLKTIRDNYPDLDRIGDDELVTHGSALCAARGQALVDQVKKTRRELKLDGKQASRILGTAHGSCGRNSLG